MGPARTGKTQLLADLFGVENGGRYVPTRGCRRFKLKLNDGSRLFVYEVGAAVLGQPQVSLAFSDKQLVVFQSLEFSPREVLEGVLGIQRQFKLNQTLPVVCLTHIEEPNKVEETRALLGEHGLTKVVEFRNTGQAEALQCVDQFLRFAQQGDHPEVELTEQQREELQSISARLDKEKVQREVMQQIRDEYARQLRRRLPGYARPPPSFAARVEELEEQSERYARLCLELEAEAATCAAIRDAQEEGMQTVADGAPQ